MSGGLFFGQIVSLETIIKEPEMDNFITQMDEMVGRLYEIQTAIEKRRHDYGSGELLTMR